MYAMYRNGVVAPDTQNIVRVIFQQQDLAPIISLCPVYYFSIAFI